MGKKPTINPANVTVRFDNTSTSTAVATWDLSTNAYKKQFDKSFKNYTVQWLYRYENDLKTSIVAEGTKTTITNSSFKNTTYSIPSNATAVYCTVKINTKKKPKFKTSTTNKNDPTKGNPARSNILPTVNSSGGAGPATDPSSAPSVTLINNNTQLRIVIDTNDENAFAGCYELFINDVSQGASSWIEFKADQRIDVKIDVSPGKVYRVRYKVRNKDKKETKWSDYSSDVKSNPESPMNFKVEADVATNDDKNSGGVTIKASWTKAGNATSYKIRYSTNDKILENNGTSGIEEVNVGDVSNAYIPGVALGQKWYFRLIASDGSIDSAHCNASPYPIILGYKPAPPTTWSSTVTGTIRDPIYLYFVHNPQDNSRLTSAQIEINIGGVIKNFKWINDRDDPDKDAIVSLSLDSALKSAGWAGGLSSYSTGATIKWKVRTKGILEEDAYYSDYSTERTITISPIPSVTITMSQNQNATSSITTLTSFPFYLTFNTSAGSQHALGYYVTIENTDRYTTYNRYGQKVTITSGTKVLDRYVTADLEKNPNRCQLTLSASDVDFEPDQSYKVTVTVSTSAGITATASHTFRVGWVDTMVEPDGDVDIDYDNMVASITAWCGNVTFNADGSMSTFTPYNNNSSLVDLFVYRINVDGTFTQLNDDNHAIINNGSDGVVDPHPTLGIAEYRIVAQNKQTGAIAFTDIEADVDYSGIIMQWDEQTEKIEGTDEMEDPSYDDEWSGNILLLPYNIQVQESNSIDVALVEYIGRSHPVSYYGTQLGYKATWNCEIEKDDFETLANLRALAIHKGNVYVREPSGTGYWAQVSVSMSIAYNSLTIPVTFNITRVEGD